MNEKKYTFRQKLIASLCNRNVEYYYATKIDKMVMKYNSLSENDKKDFLKKITISL